MAWCRQATSHYLSQYWRQSLSLGHNEFMSKSKHLPSVYFMGSASLNAKTRLSMLRPYTHPYVSWPMGSKQISRAWYKIVHLWRNKISRTFSIITGAWSQPAPLINQYMHATQAYMLFVYASVAYMNRNARYKYKSPFQESALRNIICHR